MRTTFSAALISALPLAALPLSADAAEQNPPAATDNPSLDNPAPVVAVPFEIHGGYESWILPRSEAMGMMSVGVRRQVGEHGFLGVDVYGAVRGERGGFITIGGTGGLRWPLNDRLSLETGLHVGAGGGRGGRALSGGGLLLREHVGLRYTVDGLGTFNAGLSHVDFPDGGVIHSTQAYAGFQLPFSGLLQSGGPTRAFQLPTDLETSGHSPQPQAFGPLLREVLVDANTRMDDGRIQQDFTLVGAEWRTTLGEHAFSRIEASAAMRGGVAGYMQVMGGLGWQQTLAPQLRAWSAVSVGFGGGGGVDTAGGALVQADVGLQYALARDWQVDLAAGYFAAPKGDLRAKTVTLRLARAFGQQASSQSPTAAEMTAQPLRVRFAEQHYFKGSADWRSLPAVEVGNLGFQFDYFLSPDWYVTGQGLGAYTGKAGAYMTGQLGVGHHRDLSPNTFVEVEALGGAAGGGGLRTGSGLVFQVNANLGWQLNDATALLLSVGEMKAANGAFRAHVGGLSVAYRFNALTAR